MITEKLEANIIFCVIAILALWVSCLPAETVRVRWDANGESDLSGYKIYYGTSSGSYDDVIDVGNVTSFLIDSLVVKTNYFFTLTAYDSSGNESSFSEEVKHFVTHVEDDDEVNPTEFTLIRNYPNPFNSGTVIVYSFSDGTYPVLLEVVNVKGQVIETLINEVQRPGEQRIAWDASLYSSGVYLFRLTIVGRVVTGKGLLLK